MNFIKKFFIFLFFLITCQTIHANIIRMHILPSIKFNIPVSAMVTLLTGFDKNQITLFSDNNERNHKRVNCGSFSFNNKNYTTENLLPALQRDEINHCPLHFLRQLNFSIQDDRLEILLYDNNNANPVLINLPNEIATSILKYLSNDIQDENRNCFDFFKEAFFSDININKNGNDIFSYVQISSLSPKDHLNPGDGVALFSNKPSGQTKIKHYAIALGQNLYISKLGGGGYLVVQDMQSMLNICGCEGFYKINLSNNYNFSSKLPLALFLVNPFNEF